MARREWLVLGGSGLVGWSCHEVLEALGIPRVATSHTNMATGFIHLDASDDAGLKELVADLAPPVLLYCIGATDVDRCEGEPGWAQRLNAEAVAAVSLALPAESLLVYLSSDYVFDGASGPYSEGDPPAPINVYGRTKLAGERAAASHPHHLIIRTTVVYGPESREPPKNSLGQILRLLGAGQPLRAPVDEVGTPTYAGDLAGAVIELALREAEGIYHIAGRDRVSRYDYAQAVAEVFGLDPDLILPVRSRDLGRTARRPLKHGLLCARAQEGLRRPMPSLRDGLERARRQWAA